MSNVSPVINWFEIPVRDVAKAAKLYNAMLDTQLAIHDFDGIPHGIIANADRSSSGALVADPKRPPKPGLNTTIYLNAKDGVQRALSRAVEAGAKVVQGVTSIGEHGSYALVEDLDGNVVGLHAK